MRGATPLHLVGRGQYGAISAFVHFESLPYLVSMFDELGAPNAYKG